MTDSMKPFPSFNKTQLATAVSAAVAGVAATGAQAQESDDLALEEIIVTATKRAMDMQDIAQTIQAIGQADIERAGLFQMEDYARFVPAMNFVALSPGQAKVVFRGVADAPDTFIAESSAAVYLDEQPLTMSGANVDVRMVDIERLEALSGPQGTLFGSSSQSGTLRIVTNKPDPTAFQAVADVTVKFADQGEMSHEVSGVLNIPLVEDKFAVRLVGFNAIDGGFIDNVPGVSSAQGNVDNRDTGAVKDDYNQSEWSGARLSARWFVNDSWTITPGVIYQNVKSDARNLYDPTIGDLETVRFAPENRDDEWTQYSLTIEGDLGFADLVSSTTYFDRETFYTFDTVHYAATFGINYCAFYLNYPGYYLANYCFQPLSSHQADPTAAFYEIEQFGTAFNDQQNTRFTQEIRLIHQGDRFEWVAGVFYEDHDEEWDYFSTLDGYNQSLEFLQGKVVYFQYNCYAGNQIACDSLSNYPTPAQNENHWWSSFDRTNFEQLAVFGEVTVHFNDRWTAVAGARWFDRKTDKRYWVERPAPILTPTGVAVQDARDKDWVPKVSLSYNISDDKMMYALYSEGFRPGGTNRARGQPFHPQQFGSDLLKNTEVGFKSRWGGGRVQLNATYFNMQWDDYQLEVVDPSATACSDPMSPAAPNCSQPWQKVVANVGNATSQGLDLQVSALVTEGLQFGVNAMFVQAETDGDIELQPGLILPSGTRLPITPEFKASAELQYTWATEMFGAEDGWARLQYSYTGDSINQVDPTPPGAVQPQVRVPSYTITDIAFGLSGQVWDAQLFVRNVFDERAHLFAFTTMNDWFWGRQSFVVNRPREFGFRYTYRWGGR